MRATSWIMGITLVFLASCGGGGGGTATPPNTVQADYVAGVAAIGKPIVGATVVVIDSIGTYSTGTIKTDAAGNFNVPVTSIKAPYLVKLVGGTIGGVANQEFFRAVTMSTGQVNITPLSEAIYRHITGSSGSTESDKPRTTQSLLDKAITDVTAALQKISPTNTGLITQALYGSFSATAADPVDLLLEKLSTTVGSTSTLVSTLSVFNSSMACGEILPEPTLATLPNSYTSKVLDAGYGTYTGRAPMLTNTGFVAWEYSTCTTPPCMDASTTGIRLYDPSTDVVKKLPNSSITFYSLLSLNDAGVTLLNMANTAMSVGGDQHAEITSLAKAKLWQGTTVTDSPVHAPAYMAHRAGRHTFSRPFAMTTDDGSGRKWAYPSFPSYLDGSVVTDAHKALSLGNFPVGINRCGNGAYMDGRTASGVYFVTGIQTTGRLSFAFDAAKYENLRPLGMNDNLMVFGQVQSSSMTNPLSQGFIKSSLWERSYDLSNVLDVNDAGLGVGSSMKLTNPNTGMASFLTESAGLLFAKDGSVDLKRKIPALANTSATIFPIRINNKGVILAKVCPSMDASMVAYTTCQNAALTLLTPQ